MHIGTSVWVRNSVGPMSATRRMPLLHVESSLTIRQNKNPLSRTKSAQRGTPLRSQPVGINPCNPPTLSTIPLIPFAIPIPAFYN